jgi:hypothetical protein
MSLRDWLSKATNKQQASAEQPSDSETAPEDVSVDTFAVKSKTIDPAHFGEEPISEFSRSRVVSYLADEGYKFSFDDDGDIVGVWDGSPFWFLFMGPEGGFFQVRGRWHRSVGHANRTLALQSVNDWNRDRIWPKGFVREEPDGTANSIYGESTFDFTDGITDKQLHYAINYALQCTLQMFEHMGTLIAPETGEAPED